MPRPLLVLLVLCVLAGAPGCDDPLLPGGGGPSGVVVDYPLDGSVFPPDFVPPTFLWHDRTAGVATWRITIDCADGGKLLVVETDGPPPPEGPIDERALGPTNEVYEGTAYQRSAHSWTPDEALWSEIQKRSVASIATVTIEGAAKASDEALSRGAVTISTSRDEVGAPIFYRDVPLMPARGEAGVIRPLAADAIPLIEWRLRDVTKPESKVVLTGMPSCANCHSFSLDGKTMGMDVDGPQGDKGAYAIAPVERNTVISDDEVITWNAFADKPEGHKTIGFLSRISPDGRYALTTLNESLYVANFTNFRFLQVFYPTRGILAWYSRETDEMKALPGANDPDFVHCDPAWYPHGEQIVFARARAIDPYPEGRPLATYAGDPKEVEIRYDLYRMPFDGGKGGTPVPIEGASDNGMSNTFPKVSPDGKWIVFTKCRNGQLMRPDGRLWIVPAEGGEAREMRCNTPLMNSWHSFSPNGRWMVFSSKWNTPYTQMFLTHLDEDGNDTPPILVPGSTTANRAVNIPEFLNAAYGDLDAIDVPAVEHHRRYQDGMDLLRAGRTKEAVAKFESALEEEPEFSRALLNLGYALIDLDRIEEAEARLREAVRLAPTSSEAWNNLGLALSRRGEADEALRCFRRAVELDFLNAAAHHNLGLALVGRGELTAALASLGEAVRLDPTDADGHNDLGYVLARLGRSQAAIREYRAAVALAPRHVRARKNLGCALLEAGDLTGALAQYREAAALDPDDVGTHKSLSRILHRQGAYAEALDHLAKVVELAPDDADARLALAWHLATLPDDALRDGARAVTLAEALRGGKEGVEDPRVLDVLAAAYAEKGLFEEAVRTARAARDGAAAGGPALAPGIEKRIEAYEQGRPWRQTPARAP